MIHQWSSHFAASLFNKQLKKCDITQSISQLSVQTVVGYASLNTDNVWGYSETLVIHTTARTLREIQQPFILARLHRAVFQQRQLKICLSFFLDSGSTT